MATANHGRQSVATPPLDWRWGPRVRAYLQCSWAAKRLHLACQTHLHGFLTRLADVAIAAVLSLLLLPLIVTTCALLRLKSEQVERSYRRGRGQRIYCEWRWKTSENRLGACIRRLVLDQVPRLWNLLKGDLSLVGPRPFGLDEGAKLPASQLERRSLDRPGLVSSWWIRRRANIAFDQEMNSDLEDVEQRSAIHYLAIAVRSLLVCAWQPASPTLPRKIQMLDLPIDNVPLQVAIDTIMRDLCSQSAPPKQYCFINADCVNLAQCDAAYREVLQNCTGNFADGIGMRIAGRLFGQPICENVNGTDLFPRLCARIADTRVRVFLLGGRPGVPEAVADWMKVNYGIEVCGQHHGYFTPEQEGEVLQQIADRRTNLLLVAFGAPRQDLWIARNLTQTGARVALGVGGLFDFYSGNTPRAPQWVREVGLEWVFRLRQEPVRLWRRYILGNPLFLSRVLNHVLRSAIRRYRRPLQIEESSL